MSIGEESVILIPSGSETVSVFFHDEVLIIFGLETVQALSLDFSVGLGDLFLIIATHAGNAYTTYL